MAKIIKLVPEGKVKKVPVWKNRAVIDSVKEELVRKHNEKFKQ